MASSYTTDALVKVIDLHVRSEMEKIVAEEAEAASQRVKERTAKLAPRMVMELLSNFDVMRDRQDILIRVRTPSSAEER